MDEQAKSPLKLILLISLFCALVGGGISGYLVYKNQYLPFLKEKEILERFSQVQVLEKGLSVLETWWKDGPPNVKKWRGLCPHTLGTAENVDLSYYKCNPAAIECAIDNAFYPVIETGGRFYKMTLNKIYKTESGQLRRYHPISKSTVSLSQIPYEGVIVEISLKDEPGEKIQVTLADTCNNTFLPKRTYVLGSMGKRKKDWLWDNFDRNYYIDKFLVTNREILDWIEFNNGPRSLYQKLKNKVLAAPATMLTKKQMEDYCMTYGKGVLPAHLYDAATFHPEKYEDKNKNYIYRSRYPEGGRNSKHFLEKIKKGKLDKPNSDQCRKAYGLECFQITQFEHHSRASTTWSGLYQVMGGYPEYLENYIDPKRNLKASSFYLPMVSQFHQLGKRSYWDGEGGGFQNFEAGLYPPIDKNYEVAFRCYREVEND